MKSKAILVISAIIVVGLVVGAWQGGRLHDMRQAEGFYRWLLAAGNQVRLFGELEFAEDIQDPDAPEPVDNEFFARVAGALEPHFEHLPVEEEDLDDDGEPFPAVVRAVRQGGHEWDLYRLAESQELASLRQEFAQHLRDGRLQSVGEQFELADMYAQGTLVNLGNMFLGFRQMAANLVWLEVDKYWHQGAMHRMIPLMQTTVALDPSFVDAFLLGAWHIAYNMTAPMMDTPEPLKEYDERYDAWVGDKERYYFIAVEFLKDGIRKNPTDSRLYFDLGYSVYQEKLDDPTNAARYLGEAVKYPHESYMRRMLYHAYEGMGEYERAIAGWQDYLQDFPDNQVAPLFIQRNRGLILERDAEQAYAQAHEYEAEGLETEAKQAREEAEERFSQARDIWEELIAMGGGEHPYAQTRLQRMEAIELFEEGRYYEAVAVLENARWESSEFFEEASEMIIEIKQEAGMPLTLSERQFLQRQEETERRRAGQV